MRRLLDKLYLAALWASAACLAAIGTLVGLQLFGRLLDGALSLAGFEPVGLIIVSLAEICGYTLAAASFLALAPTLKSGAHIRVTMVLSAMSEANRRYVEVFAFAFAAAAAGFMTWQMAKFAYVSFQFNEVSSGVVRVPLAYPQAMMTLGALILTISLLDEMIIVIRDGRPSFRAAEDAITLGKEG